MKRTLISVALALGMATLPVISEAGGPHGGPHGGGYGYGHGYDRGYYRGHGGYHGGGGVWPWLIGAAAVGAVVGVASQPYYGGGTVYYNAPPPPPPPPTVYYGAPAYGYVAPPQTCTYYPDGSSYCR